ncbi:MAG: DUF3048 domain-containing protein [Actinobacteria bacterium]|nr:DUF3048 domain-containing protein [Actinomycetota bacterium]
MAACSSGTAGDASSSGAASSNSSSASSQPGSPTPSVTTADRSPFTGRPNWVAKPVMVIKIPNTGRAQPHAGLTQADIVYVEEVEWGLTRIAAVFSSNVPDVVGPVRSARISDIELLAQYGKPIFAFSGAQQKMQPVIAAASLFNESAEAASQAYFRDDSRRSPDNEMVRPKDLLKLAPDASVARDIGFQFAVEPPPGGEVANTVSVRWPDSHVSFEWKTGQGYVVSFDGNLAQAAEGGGQAASTVVIQYVKQTDSGYGDMYGGHTPLAHTVGTGQALVLRDGLVWKTTWNRPEATGGTTFTLADGSPMPFAIGQPWVLLVNDQMKAVLG